MSDIWNNARFRQGQNNGFYESYFQRGNHPTRPLAFWIRYTIFSPKNDASKTEGELWAMWFDGEKNEVKKAYQAIPFSECAFANDRFDVRIGQSTLDGQHLKGACENFAWQLAYKSLAPECLLYPPKYYEGGLPKAKVLTQHPTARFSGSVTVGDETHTIADWPGAQSHNWGPKHTDLYAWAQVCGFDEDDKAFFEGATAKLKIAGITTPKLSPMVVRLEGVDYYFNRPKHWFANKGEFRDWVWRFSAKNDEATLTGKVTGKPEHFLALPYRNPPGGVKRCMNSKIARCEIEVRLKDGRRRTLTSSNRAAFEILGDPAVLEARGFR